ncbi:MAG: phosphoglucosamine mutase, partial [Microthrixaceae bacterium]|nr:phosphoglucosamine mutase [Microthrixaceae bacterium]
VLAALRTTELVRRSGRTIEALAASSMTRLPQTLVNVAISQPMPDVTERIAEALGAAAAHLGASGRVLVRPSGTEPVVRVMVEASDVDEATAVGRSLASAVETADLSRG